jgi:hypothetical protein
MCVEFHFVDLCLLSMALLGTGTALPSVFLVVTWVPMCFLSVGLRPSMTLLGALVHRLSLNLHLIIFLGCLGTPAHLFSSLGSCYALLRVFCNP